MCIRKLSCYFVVICLLSGFTLLSVTSILSWIPDKNFKSGMWVEITGGKLLSFHGSCTGQLTSYNGAGKYNINTICKTDGYLKDGTPTTWTTEANIKTVSKKYIKPIIFEVNNE